MNDLEEKVKNGIDVDDVAIEAAMQIVQKAHEVIEKNIATVQNIACLLGEHMVDTELLLSQIAQGYEEHLVNYNENTSTGEN